MNTHRVIIKKDPKKPRPDKWTPLEVYGVDNNGVSPLLLGFLWEDGKPTHIVAKMPGYSWYYNQYYGTRYSGVSVHIYTVHIMDVHEEWWEFQVESNFMEEFQQKKDKK